MPNRAPLKRGWSYLKWHGHTICSFAWFFIYMVQYFVFHGIVFLICSSSDLTHHFMMLRSEINFVIFWILVILIDSAWKSGWKYLFVEKKFWPKKIVVGNFLGEKKIGWKKNFRSKKFLGRKHFLGKKNFGSKRFGSEIFFV